MEGMDKEMDKSLMEEFSSEINMLSGMRHPNICLYMGACISSISSIKQPRAIVTELAVHGSLWDALRRSLHSPYQCADGLHHAPHWPPELHEGKFAPVPPRGTWPWMLVKKVASGAARGMTYLHEGQPPVLHRDLKSANILLDESYTAKVADFGLSRLKATHQTIMTGNCGTVQWMAPEVLSNELYAEPSDVYSFGIILWELLTCECPYEGMNSIPCAMAVLNEGRRPAVPAWCPRSLAALIQSCWAHEPERRPTFPSILEALDSISAEAPSS